MTKLEEAALATLLVAEKWMTETIAACEAESATTLLPKGYPKSLHTVRHAIRIMKDHEYASRAVP